MGLRSAYQYLKYNTYHHPVIVTSYILSIAGVAILAIGQPLKREWKIPVKPQIPRSYPSKHLNSEYLIFILVPAGSRDLNLSGYDDPE
ncbi:hypothetical protein HDU92_001641 [Lobulomyces angularis]|nr:hypothetical protein HDU92_001641 [Lobulomyces angularis]